MVILGMQNQLGRSDSKGPYKLEEASRVAVREESNVASSFQVHICITGGRV